MVARGPGAVGCAHCKIVGADRSCQICTRLVCEACAADWTTCGEPSGRMVRLGLTARLRDVDPTGRFGLVSHWRQPMRLFDLRQLRWIADVRVPRAAYLFNRRYPPRLTGDGRVIYPSWSAGSGYERESPRMFDGMHVEDLHTHKAYVVASDVPEHGTAVSATKDIFYYVTETQRVAIIDGRTTYSFDPLPRKVIHAVHLDGERRLLASGSWSEVVLHQIDDKLVRLSHRTTERTGDVTWLATGGPWLALAAQTLGGVASIEVHRIARDLTIGETVYRHVTSDLRSASMSRDGRYLAFTGTDGLVVQALDSGEETVFTEHTDSINLVRFAGDDHVLISADTDNRVVLRPRTPAGYARPIIAIDVPEAGVPLPHESRAAGV